jgi:cytochrome c-type biogenesis protein CcmH
MRPRAIGAVAVGVAAWWGALPAVAQEDTLAAEAPAPVAGTSTSEELEALVTQIASKLRCPECRAQSVAESSSRISRAMREDIRERLEAGQTPAEIEQFFLDSYGDFILLRPRARGLNLLVYLLPAVGFFAALGIGLAKMSSRRRGVGAPDGRPGDPDDQMDPDDRAWLDAAIRGGS